MCENSIRRTLISQSLTSFLNSISKTNSDCFEYLDKENYHFILANDLIATFEQIKCKIDFLKHGLIERSSGIKTNQSAFFDNLASDYAIDNCESEYTLNKELQSEKELITSKDLYADSIKQKNQFEPNSFSSSKSLYLPFNEIPNFISNATESDDKDDYEDSSLLHSVDSGFTFETSSLSANLFSRGSSFRKVNTINESYLKRDESAFINNLLYLSNNQKSIPSNNCFNFTDETSTNLSNLSSQVENSPEVIAFNLIKYFSQKESSFQQNLSQINWLVSEKEVPPKLFSLHKNIAISKTTPNLDSVIIHEDFQKQSSILKSLDSNESLVNIKEQDNDDHNEIFKNKNYTSTKLASQNKIIKIRGNNEWAPPRPQLILHIHGTPKKKQILALQNHRCCGCGLKIEKSYLPRMLYCNYIGKYFCQHGCHSNKKTLIPGYIINRWDFHLYSVSNFAFHFIQTIFNEPLFNIKDLNCNLYSKVKQFSILDNLRAQLLTLKDYLYTCKKSNNLLASFLTFEPRHFLKEDLTHCYSLHDFVDIKGRNFLIENCFYLVRESTKHIASCAMCKGRGFICELCSKVPNVRSTKFNKNMNKLDILFPFEINRVKQCNQCKACYHLECFAQNSFKCLKCIRLEKRKLSVT